MRKLDTKRAYKIVKVVVLIITLTFLVKGYFDWSMWNNWDETKNSLIKENCYRHGTEVDNFQGCETDVFNAVMDVSSAHGKGLKEDIAILILLWGGIGLYKYLFPAKDN